VKSRFEYLILLGAVALACKAASDPSPPSPPPPPPNHPPVAVVGGPYTSSDGVVNFDGSASSDADGDALTFAWNFGDGGSSSAMKPSHTYAADGDYNVSLTVTDSQGAKSAASTTTADVTLPAPSIAFMGASNIASCGSNNDERTAELLDAVPSAVVFTIGDNAFPDGSDSDYVDCYGPTWGREKARTHPTLGNHEYFLGNADGAFDYFGAAIGPRGKGYYSYDLGASWHVIVLNDNTEYISLAPGSEQYEWLTADLAANTKPCTIAMWHVPLFQSSNSNGYTSNPERKILWTVLYAAAVDIVLNGQPHHYERLKPMTPEGVVDDAHGIRSFTVGVGGESTLMPTVAIHPNSESRGDTFGVLKLTLKAGSYDWAFVPIAGASFSDSGSGSCH
jgi:PKD repeat protein